METYQEAKKWMTIRFSWYHTYWSYDLSLHVVHGNWIHHEISILVSYIENPKL